MNNRIIISLMILLISVFSVQNANATLSVLTTQAGASPAGSGNDCFIGVMGHRENNTCEATETEVYNVIPSVGTFKAMYCKRDGTTSFLGYTFTLRIGDGIIGTNIPDPLVDTALECNINDAFGSEPSRECYVVADVPVTAGDMASIKINNAFDGDGGIASCSLVFDSDETVSVGRSFLTGKVNASDVTGSSRWSSITGYSEAVLSGNSKFATVMPFAGNVVRICAAAEADPGGTKVREFILELNGANQALQTSITGTQNLNCATAAVAFVAGDLLSIENNPTGSPTAGTWSQAIEVDATTNGDFGFYHSSDDDFQSDITFYRPISSGDSGANDNTEDDVDNIIARSLVLDDMYCEINSAVTDVGDAYTITLRAGDEDALGDRSTLFCTFQNGAGTEQNATGAAVRVNGGSFIALEIDPTGTVATRDIRIGISAQVIDRIFLHN